MNDEFVDLPHQEQAERRRDDIAFAFSESCRQNRYRIALIQNYILYNSFLLFF